MEGLRNATKNRSAVDVSAKVRTGYLPNVRCIIPRDKVLFAAVFRFTHSGMFPFQRTETTGGLRAERSPTGWNGALSSSEILFCGVSFTAAVLSL